MGTVLVACDDASVQAVLTAEIEGQHHRVLTAGTGLDVLDAVAAQCPDLVVISVSLPVFNGIEVAQALRQDPDVPAHLPIILFTAETAWTPQLERAGFTDLLCVNHDVGEVADMLARHLPPSAGPDPIT